MTTPAAARPPQTRALGQRVEVRDYNGQLIRTVRLEVARKLVEPGPHGPLGRWTGSHVHLKSGIRWISPRDVKGTSGPPDLEELKRWEPERYKQNWRGSHNPHIGRGALGQRTIDSSVTVRDTTQSGRSNREQERSL